MYNTSLEPTNQMIPQGGPSCRTHVRAHEAVANSESWYGDGPPSLGEAFTAVETAKRHTIMIEILLRAAKRATKAEDTKLAEAYNNLADKLEACLPRLRCGSLACSMCARAFQKAKAAAQQTVIANLAKARSRKHLVFVSVIPKGMTYHPGQFLRIDIPKTNRWLKDALKRVGMERVVLGSVDLGWESRRGGNYLQLHWHLALWTSNPDQLEHKLKSIFLQAKKYERSVDVTIASNHGFLPYMNKAIKLPDLLRRMRTHLPELLL